MKDLRQKASRIEKTAKAIFITTAIIVVVMVIGGGAAAVFAINNPEAIGGWFGRLIHSF